MERPNPSHRNAQIYQEACEWFVEFRSGEPDDAARRAFHAWLRESPAHMGAYLDVSANWSRGATIDVGTRWSKEQLIEDARQDAENVVPLLVASAPSSWRPEGEGTSTTPRQAPSRDATQPVPRATRPPRRFLAIAASLLLVTAALAVYLLAPHGMYATTIGEQRSLSLNDGSTVQLNSLSKIRVRYSEHERTVDLLQGQALFHVAKDTARPFIVYSGRTRVRAVGTQFDVYRKDTGTTVTVLEGRVAVFGIPETADSSNPRNPASGTDAPGQATPHTLSSHGGKKPDVPRNAGQGTSAMPASSAAIANPANPAPGANATNITEAPAAESAIFLGAGEQITVTPTAARRTSQPNLARATAWTEHRLVFDATPLGDVAEEFNRYNERQLKITDPTLLDFQIDGIFSSTDPASLIRFLRERSEMQVIETNTEILVTRPPERENDLTPN